MEIFLLCQSYFSQKKGLSPIRSAFAVQEKIIPCLNPKVPFRLRKSLDGPLCRIALGFWVWYTGFIVRQSVCRLPVF